MDRPPYLILLLVAVVMVILVAWGVYTKLTAPEPAPAPAPSTQPTLVERLRTKREEALRQRDAEAAATRPTTVPAAQ